MAAKRHPLRGREQMPLFGEISKGPLRGWRFAFIRFVCVRDDIYLDLRCTPPQWPFPYPQPVRFHLTRDSFTLRAVPGERAPRLDAAKLLAEAMEKGASKPPLED
jgi:hypothetical protein